MVVRRGQKRSIILSSLFVIIIPLALMMLGIMLNSFQIVHDQPEYSLDDDPVNKLASERQASSDFFHRQRLRILKRQKRVGQYAGLVLGVFVASSWFLYSDTVKTTTASKQISAIQTFAVAESKDMVLSLTLSDGSNVQYRVKTNEMPVRLVTESDLRSTGTLQSWEIANSQVAFNVGDFRLPAGIALKMSN